MPHVPQGETASLPFLTFREALEAESRASIAGWRYVPPVYDEYRYLLGTVGAKPLICIGINPSTAAPNALDNTLKSVERIARFNGFDSFLMLNLYAQRATSPDQMDRAFNERLHQENLAALSHALSCAAARPTVWAAWGAIIEKRPYLARCARDFARLSRAFDARFVRAGRLSKAGHPHHPLYLTKDAPLEPFDISRYLASLKEA